MQSSFCDIFFHNGIPLLHSVVLNSDAFTIYMDCMDYHISEWITEFDILVCW